VASAEESVRSLLQRRRLDGLTFLDVGAGSGLFSIAALRLGAARVVAVDRDANCLKAIRQNADALMPPEIAGRLEVREGDVLDAATLPSEQFDVVYAWGSLHHTGAMWKAVGNAAACVRDGGVFAVAIYNHTWTSPLCGSARSRFITRHRAGFGLPWLPRSPASARPSGSRVSSRRSASSGG
jgi:2-polyprenyl-6-hydroxyphenyl methylase/3-demethylubiquinone-9 3-methyltransferase